MLKGKIGQASIFIIIAIVIVAGVAIFFIAQNVLDVSGETGRFGEIVSYYDQCLQENARDAIDLAGVQGGRVYAGDYIEGSEYAPFGNQLDFLGFGVPYWFSVEGNGIVRENVPTKTELEQEIGKYVSENIENCDFDSFRDRGFTIEIEQGETRASLDNNGLSIDSKAEILISD